MHKSGTKGEGSNIIIIENDIVSGHSFFKNNPKIIINEYFSNEEDDKGCHGAHITGIAHQMAPEAEIFVERFPITNYEKIVFLSTPAKIVNTSYSLRIPLLHLLPEEKLQELKGILSPTHEINEDQIKKIFKDDKRFDNIIRYITQFSEKPRLGLQPSLENDLLGFNAQLYEQNESEQEEYEKEIKAYEEDYAGTVIKKAIQKSYHDAKGLHQDAIDLYKGKLRIQSFGNAYQDKDWRYCGSPSLLMEDEFLNQSIIVMNIDRENKLNGSSNRPDHTLREIIQTVLKNNGIDDPKLVDQKLQKVQASSLCALGTNVWSAGAHDSYESQSGTSMAASMVTGVAGLIEGKYADFSTNEIRKCLLNSASRQFVIGTGQDERHAIDLPQDQIDLLNQKNLGLRKYIAFDPAQYGKGILDADATLKYAEFKSANRSAAVDELVAKLSQWKRNQE